MYFGIRQEHEIHDSPEVVDALVRKRLLAGEPPTHDRSVREHSRTVHRRYDGIATTGCHDVATECHVIGRVVAAECPENDVHPDIADIAVTMECRKADAKCPARTARDVLHHTAGPAMTVLAVDGPCIATAIKRQ